MFFYLFTSLIILQRIYELRLARRNRLTIQAAGGIEVGQGHYRWIVLLHTCFFLALIIEFYYLTPSLPNWWWFPFSLFLLAQGLRIWVITTLGFYWNTRIFVIPGSRPRSKGPYRWIRHPNYFVVIIEILSIPLIFGLFFTATLFTILNLFMITYRISIEEKALTLFTSYREIMESRPKIIPFRKR